MERSGVLVAKRWEFFEKLDEMVYVSDIETYELMYMNQYLRNALGYKDHEEYRGEKCYKILQSMDKPCAFCTNCQLREGEFVTWTHKNPVLHRHMLLKDTLVHANGRDYRVEIAINANSEADGNASYYYARSETILNECMQEIFSTANAEKSIDRMLSYIGKTFSCDRAYIFEISGSMMMSNTYEWCADGVVPQRELLQTVPMSAVDWWLSLFADNKVTVIADLEDIRAEYPESYALLKPQDIHCLAAGPIKSGDEIIGFIGVDNPDKKMMPMIESFLNVIGYFTSTLIRRRELVLRLNNLSYHDQLTGVFNRYALTELYGDLSMHSMGVVYCDITGLKRVNDVQGHEAGDQMIRHCCELIRTGTETEMVYRTGGDEFVALCPNCGKADFLAMLHRLQDLIVSDKCHIAVGHAWSDHYPLNLEKLIQQADQSMYEDKREYYQANRLSPGVERRKPLECGQPTDQSQGAVLQEQERSEAMTPFQTFLDLSRCDTEVLFQSVAQDNESSYFYMGDMQSDLFYISDNMRDDFGFPGNLVYGLLKLWVKRISTPEFQDLYWQDISRMLREKRTVHDLRYRVRDVRGNNQWVRCYGILKWNEDKTKPLFFSGRVTHQDTSFVVDPITGFPREHASLQQLEDLRKSGEKTLVMGFSLNGLAEVNSTRGRECGDRLLKKVANTLLETLSWEMTFYRLEGMRCMAILNPVCVDEGADGFIEQLRSVIKKCYESKDISVRNVSSFGVIEFPCADIEPEDLAETLVSLIRVAKQEPALPYVDYSSQNIKRIKQMSNMALALSQDVANHMEHFRIVVQPVVSSVEGKAIGGEVLLRWSFEGQNISPAIFIPILEREGLIQMAGRWVFEQAVCTCVRLRAHNPDFYLTFNVSLHQLSDTQLIPFMKMTLQRYGLDGSGLVAELTESSLDERPTQLARFVHACQDMELRIALDDFGSGYSSLRMLLQYPMSIIKLDQSLVRQVAESEAKMNFIQSIVYACHQFGKTVCMEGVEQAEENEIILNTGCDLIQGYYYYRPMELHDLYRLVSQTIHEMLAKEDNACKVKAND